MADIHHNPTPHGIRAHTVAGTVIGVTLFAYAVLMIGQAVGLYTL